MVGTMGTADRYAAMADRELDREIEELVRLLEEYGPTDMVVLARRVHAPAWGPGRFRNALREAVKEGRAERVSRDSYGPAHGSRAGRDQRSRSPSSVE
jgi:hypothetical protein